MDISVELSVFNNIKYYDKEHKYYIDGKEMVSATRLIGTFKQAFDSEYWSQKKATERGITTAEILKEWKYKSDYSCEKGNLLHDYAENYLNNKIFPYPKEKVIKILGNNDVEEAFEKLKKLFKKFYSESYGKLIPIKSEIIVGDEELGICGMVDQLFWNNKSEELQIWDWKTNKEIKRNNKWQQFKDPISHLDVCEYNTYSLQLSLYRYLIEKNTHLKLGDSYIVWFNEKNENYEPIKCRDYREEIISLIETFNNK
jgi:ATP-dependent exoDNAse (exonuclease V) beta subunit